MKVLLITPLPPAVGGIARWSEAYLGWSEGKFETVVVNNAIVNAGTSRISRILSQIKRTIRILRDLSKKIKTENVDVAHINSSCAKVGIFRDYICARKLAKKNIPVLLQCHGNIEDQLRGGRISRYFFRKTAAIAAKTLVLNNTSFNFAVANGAKDVVFCPNFIAEEKISKDLHKINSEIKRALYVGHLYREKGVELLLELAEKHPDIEFRLVGPYTKDFDNSTVCAPNVVFTDGKDAAGVVQELDEADVFVLLSYSEGFSNAMLEAMARGVPVIASDVGAARDMIGEKGGVVVPIGDIASASAAIDALAGEEVRKEASEFNRAKVLAEYKTDAVLGTISNYYKEIKNGR